jgi:general stress protein YciG
MASIGKKGGQAVSKNRDHMAAIGRKGGEAVSRDRSHMATIGRRGGESVSRDREHMAAIGREGGESRAVPRELETPAVEAERIEAQIPAPAEPGAIPTHEFPRSLGEEKPEEKPEEGEGRRAA